ncbi:DUF4011 domain-containing protein [Brevibacterium album]|uniref:DUF4011 domain-containing protein n=1 Tax=Brevibacterium album TaxID=417948 RepID=UPI00041BCD53|nr:DUF4011 domain-containing protein [Brevibacterium album]
MSHSDSTLPQAGARAVGEAFAAWQAQAARIGGRDTMLHFRDSRDGSIDLTGAHPSGLAQLLAGRATRLSSLLRDPEHLADARRRARSIRSKADQLSRERGLTTAHLAIGFASWSREGETGREEFGAPVVLRHVTLVPRGSSVDDYEIRLGSEVHINPALVDYLHREHDVEIDVDEWADSTRAGHGFDPAPVFERLRAVTRAVPGMLVNERLVVSTFANIADPYTTEELPEAHPLLRALAGDAEARVGFGGSEATGTSAAPTGNRASHEPDAHDGSPRREAFGAGDGETPDAEATDVEATDAEARNAEATTEAEAASGTGPSSGEPAPAEDGEIPESAPRTRAASVGTRRSRAAARRLRATGPLPLTDRAPHEEFLAIDVDGDQQAVVDAALDGQSLVVDTPPGTGATQLAVALATTLSHAGRSVLYVAQDAADLDEFGRRMEAAGLTDFTVDGRGDREELRRALIKLITSAERSPKPELTGLVETLTEHRTALSEHIESLHRIREPWGVSAYEVMQRLAALTSVRPGPSTSVRFGREVLELTDAERSGLRRTLLTLSDRGAFTLDVADTVWFGARFETNEEAERARSLAERARELVPAFSQAALPVLRKSGLNPERTVGAWGRSLELLQEMRATLDVFGPEVFEHSLADLIAATGTSEYRAQHGREMGLLERNRLRKAAKEFLRPGASAPDMHAGLLAAAEQRRELRELAGADIRPKVPRGVPEAVAEYRALSAALAALSPYLEDTPDGGDLEGMLVEELEARLDALAEDRLSLRDLPERTRLDDELRDAGLGELLDDLRARRVPHELVGLEFDLAHWATVLQDLAGADALIGAHDGDVLNRIAAEYRLADRQYVAAGASRLRYSHAKRWKAVIGEHRNQAQELRQELRSPHLDVRRLSTRAPEILSTLAPVWAASPFRVPELFAEGPRFDTVILADAGRLTTAEALPALARARQVVAMGDERLLEPREFSVAVDRRPRGPRKERARSVFAELSEFLPARRLHTSYRVSPLELVELANRHFYDSSICIVPTALTGEGTGLEFAYVPDALGTPDNVTGQVESLDVEVDRVVDLVIRHARTRSRQSLGVVTLTPWHAQRVAAAIQKAIRQYPYVASFFESPGREPFIVTDVTQVHGMVRDAVILSLGYGRTRQGRVIHSFGVLSEPGGERCLAAALTRARRRLTVVSAFEAEDFDPARLSGGARLLPDILAEVASGGEPTARDSGAVTGTNARADGGRTDPSRIATEPFEELGDPIVADLAERLSRKGVMAHLDYQGIDLAIANSADDLHGMVVAVETDGPAYAGTRSIRQRERLRSEQLARRGWRSVRVWTTDAFVDPQQQAGRLFDAWRETVEELSPQALLNAARAAAVVVDRQGSRPRVASGLPMHMYTDDQLVAMLEWIQSDGVARGDAELKEQLRAALAQKNRRGRTESALEGAVRAYRRQLAELKHGGEAGAEGGAGSGRGAPAAEAAEARDSSAEGLGAAGPPVSEGPHDSPGRARGEEHSEDGDSAASSRRLARARRGAAEAEYPRDEDGELVGPPADSVLPPYDTDSLRHAELRDAGLRPVMDEMSEETLARATQAQQPDALSAEDREAGAGGEERPGEVESADGESAEDGGPHEEGGSDDGSARHEDAAGEGASDEDDASLRDRA